MMSSLTFVLRLTVFAGVASCAAEAHGAPSSRDFDAWLADLRRETLDQGISSATVDAALDGLRPLDRVLELQARQPEQTMSLENYLARVVPQSRIDRARQLAREHASLLASVSAEYGVQPRFIVALWGIESDFGQNTGEVSAVGSLATLAFAGRRASYFRRELIELLKLLDADDMNPALARGSWAGALGQCQFMPSNVRRYAVDWDRDGRRDIWNSTPDVLASIARFLSALGWRDDETWGRRVLLPASFDVRLAGRDVKMKIARWQALDVRRLNGADLPKRELWAAIIVPDGVDGRAYMVYDDFNTLLKWNYAIHFAVAVGHLSERLR